MTYTIDGVEYTKQEVWSWLKAENHHKPPREKMTPVLNRTQRRTLMRSR